jgi:transposase
MPELGALEAGQAANLAGLAPIARQSGRWTGHSFIRGGRADVRQALYMPALVAARFNPDMKAKYAHLKELAPKALDIRGADLGHSITQIAIDDGVDSRPIFNRFRLTSFASVA